MHKITLIPGDGVGPEVTEAARACIEATGVKIDWDVIDVDGKKKITIDRALASIKSHKVALKGPIPRPLAKVSEASMFFSGKHLICMPVSGRAKPIQGFSPAMVMLI